MPYDSFYRYWGKAGAGGSDFHLLCYHCLDAAAIAFQLLSRDNVLRQRFSAVTGLPEKLAIKLAVFFTGLHDGGKITESFQNLRPDLFEELSGRTSNRAYHHRHDLIGVAAWLHILLPAWLENGWFGLDGGIVDEYDFQDVIRSWIWASGGHHGRPPEMPLNLNSLIAKWFTQSDRAALISMAGEVYRLVTKEEKCVLPSDIVKLTLHFGRSSWLMAGLAVLCDWLASNSSYFPFCGKVLPLEGYWCRAVEQAGTALESSGLLPSPPAAATGMATLFSHIQTPSPLQKHLSECSITPGAKLFIIEEATGSGKTEAALVLAHRLLAQGEAESIFIGLPTMATANAMYSRLADSYQHLFSDARTASLVLAHSARRIHKGFRKSITMADKTTDDAYGTGEESVAAQCAAWLADNNKKALLASLGVGTVDQAALSVLPIRHQSLRLLGLSRSVLIVDEVHAYDKYLEQVLCGLLKFMASWGGSVILLSATLHKELRQRLVNSFLDGLDEAEEAPLTVNDYPMVTQVQGGRLLENYLEGRTGTGRTIKVDWTDRSEAVEARLLDVVQQGGCACWIRNTVDDALEAYESLLEAGDPSRIRLFHARMAMCDRLAVEGEILSTFGRDSQLDKRSGQILVATQVIEQSLDLDFDFLVCDLAPMDLMIQRIGRLHRHERRERPTADPVALVYGPLPEAQPGPDWYRSFFSRGAWVYESHGRLWLTATILANRGRIRLPGEARDLIEGVFGTEAGERIPEALQDRELVSEGKSLAERAQARLNCLSLDEGYSAKGVPWQEDTPTRLGLPVSILRLARWDGARLTPWAEENALHPWALSQVTVRKSLVAEEMETTGPSLAAAVKSTKGRMPDKGKYSLLIPLSHMHDKHWQGMAKDGNGREVTLIYYSRTGLKIEK